MAISCCTATMSARGTMTLSTRHSRSPKIFLSMAASSGEKPDCGCSAVRTCSRSARVAAAFQPNRMRMTRVSQPSCGSSGCATTIGRARCSPSGGALGGRGLRNGGGLWLLALASNLRRISALASGLFHDLARMPIRIRDVEVPQDFTLGLLHNLRVGVFVVIVSDEVQKTMHRQMGKMMRERLALGTGFASDGLVGQDDVAEVRRFVRGFFARKRQYVGGGVDAAPKPVELTDRRIIGQNDSKLRPGC